jgi:hypothetical protein
MRSLPVFAAVLTCFLLASPALATIYHVTEVGLQDQQCFPNCATTGSLRGTISTDGTIGSGLSPNIITAWSLAMDDGAHVAILNNVNSVVGYNFIGLLSASHKDLNFDFSPTPCCIQQTLQFTSSSNGAQLISIFAELKPSFPGDPRGSLGGIAINLGFTGLGSVKYLEDVQTIASVARAIPEPSTWAMLLIGFAGVGLLAFRSGRDQLPPQINNRKIGTALAVSCYHTFLLSPSLVLRLKCTFAIPGLSIARRNTGSNSRPNPAERPVVS